MLFFFLIVSMPVFAQSWERFLDETVFPESQFLQDWRESTDFVIEGTLSPDEAGSVKLQCPSDKLWPTHPSQSTKEYLWAQYAHYDHYKVPVTSYACIRANPTRRFCVMAAIAQAVVMSDTFEDECGNFYRGYWLVTYFRSDENMGTLYSKGRTAYPRPESEYEYDMIEGETYSISASDFLVLGKLRHSDHEKISIEQDRALKAGFKRVNQQFLRLH